MRPEEVRVAVDRLLAAQPGDADRDGIAATLSTIRRVRGALDSIEVACTRRMRELADTGRAEPAESLLGSAGGMGSRAADAAGERERVCGETSDVEDALGAGEVTAAHVDAIAAAARQLPEELRQEFFAHEQRLLAAARNESVDHFRRRCRRLAGEILAAQPRDEGDELTRQRKRSRVKRWVDDMTGMHHTHLELDRERDARLWAAISSELRMLCDRLPAHDRPSARELEAEAAVSAATSGGDRSSVASVQVLVDYDRLMGQLDATGLCETEDGTPLPIETVRRMCCEADIIPTVMGGPSEVLDVGRERRTATRAQRRNLRARYSTCAHPQCQVPFSSCNIHHVDWWRRDAGPTDIDNLVPLCEHHHHMVHEGGWSLTMTPDRVTTWTRPDGVVWWSGDSTNRQVEQTLNAC